MLKIRQGVRRLNPVFKIIFHIYIMTQLLSILVSSQLEGSLQGQNSFIEDQLGRALSEAYIDYSQDGNLFTFLLPLYYYSEQCFSQFLNYAALGTISLAGGILKLSFSFLDQTGLQLKAKSTYHKIFMTKFCMILNAKSKNFHVKVSPLTGRFIVECSYFILFSSRLKATITEAIQVFKKESKIIIHVLEVLELINPRKNMFLIDLLSKIEPMRGIILQTNQNKKINSANQEMHTRYMFSDKPHSIIINQTNNSIERMKKTYIDGYMPMFVFNSNKIKVSNFSYWTFDENHSLSLLLKTVDEPYSYSKEKNGTYTDVFQAYGREHVLNVTYLKAETISEEHIACEKLCRKKCYYSFIREYVIARNYLSLSKMYILTKCQGQKLMSLNVFLTRSSATISFQTRLKLASQILCIAFICLFKNESFYPRLTCSNFLIDCKLCMKLNRLKATDLHPSIELKQALYKILFNKQIYSTPNNVRYQEKPLISFVDKNVKNYGPSHLVKAIVKAIQILDIDIAKIREQKIKESELSNLLLIITRISDVFQKMISTSNKEWLGVLE